MKADELRNSFLKFFEEKEHKIVASDSLIPSFDPTVLFTSAGMNQFKNDFLGKGNRDYKRAVTSQKCLRTQDLDIVGRTFFHHTFFEMLGNFSFGDYFKRETIHWDWEWFTKVLKLPIEKLSVSVYETDDEAYAIWRDEIGVPDEKIYRFDAKENYWPANSPNDKEYRGPCGPCSEIFYDLGEVYSNGDPNEDPSSDGNRFCEIGNLVFQQFNKIGESSDDMEPLPAPGIDVGIGFERVLAVINGKVSSYQTDLFESSLQIISELSGKNYEFNETPESVMMQRIADHARAVCFLVGDGIWPSNEGRGYVLRKVMRRAIRDGRQLGIEGIFLKKLVQPNVDLYGKHYPEIIEQREMIENVIVSESEQFLKTLDSGEKILNTEIDRLQSAGESTMSGEIVFELESTYGFPSDLTVLILGEIGLNIDNDELLKERQHHKEISKGEAFNGKTIFDNSLDIALKQIKSTEFAGYDKFELETDNFVVLDTTGNKVNTLQKGVQADLYSDITPFYAEKGGQVGDKGKVRFGQHKESVKVIDCNMREDLQRHVLLPEQDLDISKVDKITLRIDIERRNGILKHHTATHILHYALRQVLGKHVHQKGSLVSPDRLRFDFTHLQAMTPEEIEKVERAANAMVLENYSTDVQVMGLEEAKKKGAMALFGEKYSADVRVITVGPSIELCGGTHVSATGEIGQIRITGETSVAKGVRRIEAVAGMQAVEAFEHDRRYLKQIADKLKVPEERIIFSLHKMEERERALKFIIDLYHRNLVLFSTSASNDLKEEAHQNIRDGIENLRLSSGLKAPEVSRILSLAQEIHFSSLESLKIETINGIKFLVDFYPDKNMKSLEEIADDFREKNNPSGVLLIGGTEKLHILAGCTKDAVKKGFDYGKLVKEIAEILGGKGGGAPHFARGSGKDNIKVQEALKKAKEILQKQIN
ncbi:MAG: alanine--tRNA ligase [Planctomycetes bacterium]|nr:alanine--tRNA ligase [Planctomycetota bacterium]